MGHSDIYCAREGSCDYKVNDRNHWYCAVYQINCPDMRQEKSDETKVKRRKK